MLRTELERLRVRLGTEIRCIEELGADGDPSLLRAAKEAIERLELVGQRYQRSVVRVFETDPTTKACFAEGSPTKSQEVYDRFIELNDAGKAFAEAFGQSQ